MRLVRFAYQDTKWCLYFRPERHVIEALIFCAIYNKSGGERFPRSGSTSVVDEPGTHVAQPHENVQAFA